RQGPRETDVFPDSARGCSCGRWRAIRTGDRGEELLQLDESLSVASRVRLRLGPPAGLLGELRSHVRVCLPPSDRRSVLYALARRNRSIPDSGLPPAEDASCQSCP